MGVRDAGSNQPVFRSLKVPLALLFQPQLCVIFSNNTKRTYIYRTPAATKLEVIRILQTRARLRPGPSRRFQNHVPRRLADLAS
ncbi:hypothetical protein AcV7_006059 [Taiwanofungus camphoratus]|nr:hypothetical protein AcV7_006059 [Antrodia cinnamomea]